MTRGTVRRVTESSPTGARRGWRGRTRSRRSELAVGSAPMASSSMSGGPPTACSSSTTTPAGRRPGHRRDAVAGAAGVRADARRGPRRLRRRWVNIEIKNDAREPDFDPLRPRRRRGAGRRSPSGPGRWLISSFRLATVDRCRLRRPDRADGVADDRRSDRHASTLAPARATRRVHPWEPTRHRRAIERCHAAGLPSTPGRATTRRVVALARPASTASSPTSPTSCGRPRRTESAAHVVTARRPQTRRRERPERAASAERVRSDGHRGITSRTASGTWRNSRRSISPR